MGNREQQRLAERLLQQADHLAASGRLAESVVIIERVLGDWPLLADTWYNLGLRRRSLGRPHEALAAYGRALELGAAQPEEIHLNRGVIYADDLLQPDAAEREYQLALQRSPDYLPALLNLANLREDAGRRRDAQELYERILAGDATHAEALARLANCSVISAPDEPLVARLRHAIGLPGRTPAERASLGFALARALDAAGAYDEAWEACRQANAASRVSASVVQRRYDRVAEERRIGQLIDCCDAAFLERVGRDGLAAAAADPALVMISGMFRSGSTLVESLLAAHPQVTAGGELDWMPAIVREALEPFPASLGALEATRCAALAVRYLERRASVFPAARVLTDKRPDNFLHLGLIRAMLPGTRFVHTRRHPLDNCLSVWFLHLEHDMAYATDLMDIGHHYLQQERLLVHWRTLLGEALHSVDYDSLVREPRGEIQRLLAHCGLDWDERCLDPGNHAGPLRTASVWQARRPLYRESSGRWRNYARHLEPLREFFSRAGLSVDG